MPGNIFQMAFCLIHYRIKPTSLSSSARRNHREGINERDPGVMSQVFPGKLSRAYVHRRPGKREVEVGQEVGLLAGKSRDGRDDLTCGDRAAYFQGFPGDGMSKRGYELSAAGCKDGMAHKDGLPQKIPVDFDDVTGKRRGDFRMLTHGFGHAVGIGKTVQVQTFMRGRAPALIPPPFYRSLKQHARMEDPLLEAIHPGPVMGHHKFHKCTLEVGRWGHG